MLKVLDSKDPNPLFSAYVKPGATPVPVEIQGELLIGTPHDTYNETMA